LKTPRYAILAAHVVEEVASQGDQQPGLGLGHGFVEAGRKEGLEVAGLGRRWPGGGWRGPFEQELRRQS
jgi:hypothetical protein